MPPARNQKELKQLFLEEFKKKACNISATCAATNVSRSWYYTYREKDKKFREELEAMEAEIIDMAETQLYKNIREGKETSLIFFLKCKGKDRGYIERQEIDSTVKADVGFHGKVEIIDLSQMPTDQIKEILGKK